MGSSIPILGSVTGVPTLESRLRRDFQPYFKSTGWSDEIIEEVEQLNERLAASG